MTMCKAMAGTVASVSSRRWLGGAASLLLCVPALSFAQTATPAAPLQGTVSDAKGSMLAAAAVTVRDEGTGRTVSITADGQGHFSLSGLAPGSYTVEASANGFSAAAKKAVRVAAGHTDGVALTLQIASASDQVEVDANETKSIAAALAPMDALLDEHSARTEITAAFIQNFTSPLADYGEAVEMAPGTFTTNGNGVGLGQSKTYFRGFSDGNYDIDFDGIPFYDTNSPTHHSWAFFPSQWLGGIDFDRSPGTASTIGPTPFGGSIHLLSRDFSPLKNLRGGVSYGSFGTMLADFQLDSGLLGASHKASLLLDVQHMDSKGYETNNFQNRNAGSVKAQYKFSDKTILTGFAGVVFLDANTPNFNATRCQMYGVAAGYSCTTGTGTTAVTSPYTGAGINFYLAGNTDPYSGLNYTYNRYHVPTDFEYVGLHKELPFHLNLESKSYTYDYDNSEVYSNLVPITEGTTINGATTYQGVKIVPCNTTSGVAPCGVDKYNSYRKYGETLALTQVSKIGIVRAGLWYEWAKTNRHQFPADPLNHYVDIGLPNFSEMFWNNSYQPYAEYEAHPTSKLSVVAGTKFAYFKIDTKQLPDNGKTIGNLCNTTVTPNICAPFISNHGSYSAWLPSIDGNYRVRSNWSVYGQLSTGSIVPPSNVFDYNQTVTAANPTPTIAQAPKQQRSTTYQFGSVIKAKRATLDVDFYHVKFQNSYTQSTVLDPVVFYLQPGSISKGFEAESNLYLTRGLSLYLNASFGNAYYHGNLPVSCTTGTTGCTASTAQIVQAAPAQLWVATSPTDTEAEGLTYQHHAFDFGMFNKRVGSLRQDNGAYHNQGIVDPFTVTNAFLNYTLRSGTHFDQTKIRLSFNNLLDNHNQTSLGLKGTALTQNIAANGATYKNPFTTTGFTPASGLDQIGVLAGRSIVLSVTFGLSPKR